MNKVSEKVRPVWAGLPLGFVDDLYSGQPFGSAMLLWSLAMIALEAIETRWPWRSFLLDWFAAAVLTSLYLLFGVLVANASSNNRVQGNLIGTNAAATGGIGNGQQGVGISGAGSNGNSIGGRAIVVNEAKPREPRGGGFGGQRLGGKGERREESGGEPEQQGSFHSDGGKRWGCGARPAI